MRLKMQEVLFRDTGVELSGAYSKAWKSDDGRNVLVEADTDLRLVILTVLRGVQEGKTVWVPFEMVDSMRPHPMPEPVAEMKFGRAPRG